MINEGRIYERYTHFDVIGRDVRKDNAERNNGRHRPEEKFRAQLVDDILGRVDEIYEENDKVERETHMKRLEILIYEKSAEINEKIKDFFFHKKMEDATC